MKKILVFMSMALMYISSEAQNFVEEKTNILNLNGGACAWGDYDNDGDVDLFISGTDSIGHLHSIIYRNDKGKLIDIHADILGVAVGAMADWGDYDNDGDLDLLIAGADYTSYGRTRIYRNDDGVFTDIKSNILGFRMLSSAKWGDYNNDGKLDIFLSGFSDDVLKYVTIIYKNSNDNFNESDIKLPGTSDEKSKAWIDYDGDGDLDIYFPGRLGSSASLYKNNSGTFSKSLTNIQITNNYGSSDWSDFDNDGNKDIAIMGISCNYINSGMVEDDLPIAKVYRNVNNSFIDIDAGLLGLYQGDIKWIDYDADGNQDIFITGSDRYGNLHSKFYRNDSGKFVSAPVYFPGFNWANAAVGDFNNDNAPDLIITGVDSLFKPVTKLYKNTVEKKLVISSRYLCGNTESVLIYYVGDISNIDSFAWDFNGGYILKGSKNGPFRIKWETLGEKNIKLVVIKKSGNNETLTSKVAVYPGINVSLGKDTTVNYGTSITLHPQVEGGTLPYLYFWDNIEGDSDKTYKIVKDTLISLNVKDNNGCKSRSKKEIKVPINNFAEQICLVTVDTSFGKNIMVWKKTNGKRIKDYIIFKETTNGGTYSVIGSVPFSGAGIYLDQNSNPSQHADRYKLGTIDSSGYQVGLSDFHQTIHLAINQGLPGTYNLMWTPYIGFDYGTYYIYKGSSPDNLELVDSLANTYNQCTDTSFNVSYYQIAVRKDAPCYISNRKSTGDPFSQSVSNLEDNLKYVGVKGIGLSKDFIVRPNPFDNELTVEGFINSSSNLKIEIFNLMGVKVYEYAKDKQPSGYCKLKITTGQFLDITGFNIMRIEAGNNVYYKRIVKK